MTSTALILAGCGARGIIQAGMIQAFDDLGLEYDALYGSSAGALNGALLHAGQLEDMVTLWQTIRNKDVYSPAPWNVVRENHGCLLDSRPMLKLIGRTIKFNDLVENEKPFVINVTECYPGWKGLGINATEAIKRLPEVLWASASPPVLMPPVKLGDKYLTDGGVTNNYPVISAVREGADRLIILAPMIAEPEPIKNIVDSIDATISIQISNQLVKELSAVEIRNSIPGYRKIEIIVVTLDKPTGIGILDFDLKDRDKWLNYGYDLAIKKLEGIR